MDRYLNRSAASREQVGDQTSICWIASNCGASQKMELLFAPAGPETVKGGSASLPACRIGVQRGPAGTCHNSGAVVNRVFTRMSLAGYSSIGLVATSLRATASVARLA